MTPADIDAVVDEMVAQAAIQIEGVPTATPLGREAILALALTAAASPSVRGDRARLACLLRRLLPFLQGTAAEPDGEVLPLA